VASLATFGSHCEPPDAVPVAGSYTVNPESGSPAFVAESSAPRFPCGVVPAASYLAAGCRSAAAAAQTSAAYPAEAAGTGDRSEVRVSADRAATLYAGSATVLSGAPALVADMAVEPRIAVALAEPADDFQDVVLHVGGALEVVTAEILAGSGAGQDDYLAVDSERTKAATA
jgi:hypothetical protein